MNGDLTTLTRLKLYLGITNTSSDTLLAQFITAVSSTVLNYVGRSTFGLETYADVYDGNGKEFMLLRQWPVTEVASVEMCGTTVPASPDTTTWPPRPGFVVEAAITGGAQQRLLLFGYAFPNVRAGVRVTYTAGYRTLAEAHTVPATPFQVTTDNVWVDDLGVTLANGTALVAVDSSPAAGQYSVAAGIYTFNTAQAAAGVLISYASVPATVTEAVNEMAAEAYKRKDRLGIVSQSVAGQETVSYSQKDMSNANRLSLNAFRRITPA